MTQIKKVTTLLYLIFTTAVLALVPEWYSHYTVGKKLIEEENFQEAVTSLDKAIALEPVPMKGKRYKGSSRTDYYPYYYKALALSQNNQLSECHRLIKERMMDTNTSGLPVVADFRSLETENTQKIVTQTQSLKYSTLKEITHSLGVIYDYPEDIQTISSVKSVFNALKEKENIYTNIQNVIKTSIKVKDFRNLTGILNENNIQSVPNDIISISDNFNRLRTQFISDSMIQLQKQLKTGKFKEAKEQAEHIKRLDPQNTSIQLTINDINRAENSAKIIESIINNPNRNPAIIQQAETELSRLNILCPEMAVKSEWENMLRSAELSSVNSTIQTAPTIREETEIEKWTREMHQYQDKGNHLEANKKAKIILNTYADNSDALSILKSNRIHAERLKQKAISQSQKRLVNEALTTLDKAKSYFTDLHISQLKQRFKLEKEVADQWNNLMNPYLTAMNDAQERGYYNLANTFADSILYFDPNHTEALALKETNKKQSNILKAEADTLLNENRTQDALDKYIKSNTFIRDNTLLEKIESMEPSLSETKQNTIQRLETVMTLYQKTGLFKEALEKAETCLKLESDNQTALKIRNQYQHTLSSIRNIAQNQQKRENISEALILQIQTLFFEHTPDIDNLIASLTHTFLESNLMQTIQYKAIYESLDSVVNFMKNNRLTLTNVQKSNCQKLLTEKIITLNGSIQDTLPEGYLVNLGYSHGLFPGDSLLIKNISTNSYTSASIVSIGSSSSLCVFDTPLQGKNNYEDLSVIPNLRQSSLKHRITTKLSF